MTLRIVDCSILQYHSQLKRAFSTSRGTTRGNTNYIVVITAEHDGRQFQGVGEAVPRRTLTGDPSTAVWPFLTAAADHLRGMDLAMDSREACLDSIRARLTEIRAIARRLVPDGDERQPLRGSLTGVEAALLDIGARAFDISIAELLGGSLKPVRVTADTISAGSSFEDRAKHLADRAKRFVAWRVKTDANEDATLDYLRGLTGMNATKGLANILWLDFNQALSQSQAEALIDRVVAEHAEGRISGKIMMEQPTPKADIEALPALQSYADARRRDGLEFVIMADESLHTLEDWRNLAAHGACGAINIKVPKAGGLLASIEIAREAVAHNPDIEIYIGGMLATTDITAWGIYQLACAIPGFRYTTTNPSGNLVVNFASNHYRFRSRQISFIDPPDEPGLGSGVDFALLAPLVKRYHPATARNFLRTATTQGEGRPRHSYDWPEAVHFSQLAFDSCLLQTCAIAHGMQTQRLTDVLFTSARPEAPEKIVGFWWSAGNFASRYGIMICGQKQLTRIMLRSSGVPVPEGRKFLNNARKSAIEYARRIGWPVVVKPAAGGGGRAVTTNIRSEADVRSAIEAVKPGESFIVEKHVEGSDYRLLATENAVISVFTRRAARVTGDGESNVARLVEQANKQREANPRYRNSLIKISAKTVQHMLRQQGLTPDSVPEKDAVVILSPAANISQGGEGVDVTAETHPSILDFALAVRRGLPGLGHCGIDLLMEDHRKPVSEQSLGVCEVNSYSEIGMHCFPSEGDYADAAEALYLYNAQRAEVHLDPRAELVSLRLRAEGVSKPAQLADWIKGRAVEFGVHLEEMETDAESVSCVVTGWVRPVAALAALAIAPDPSLLVEVVTTRPLPARVLPVLARPQEGARPLHALISGKVQGVGYRIWLQKEARAHGVNGFVRNIPDGRVEAVLVGPRPAVDTLLTVMREGPDRAEVRDIQTGEWTGKKPPRDDFLRFRTVKSESAKMMLTETPVGKGM